MITKYQDIADIVADPVTFPQPSYGGVLAPRSTNRNGLPDVMARNTLRPTLELHKQHRLQLTDPWGGAVGAPRHRAVTNAVDELIDRWIDKGEVEFVSEFAAVLPQIVMETILGFPREDHAKALVTGRSAGTPLRVRLGYRNLMSPEEEKENAEILGQFMAYVQGHVAAKRQAPSDDMITFLTQVDYMGRKLTDQEVTGVVFGMHIGGLETTQYALTSEAQILAEEPELFRVIKADRSKLRFFVGGGAAYPGAHAGLVNAHDRERCRDIEGREDPRRFDPASSLRCW